MQPSLNQSTKLRETQRFDDLNDITVEQLNFRPIIAQIGTYM